MIRNGVGVSACTLFVDPPCCTVGNPVTAVTGIKLETETDYRGAGGLVFTRHYHSFVFPDPITITPDGHSQLQLGATWRSNFDKRVIPVGNTGSGINALTFPEGRIQYFDTLGAEIFNYSGARASLVEQVRHYQVPLWGKTCRTVETPLPLPPGVNPKSLRALAPGYETTTRCEPRGIPFRYVSAAGIISIALGSWFVIVSRSQRGQ